MLARPGAPCAATVGHQCRAPLSLPAPSPLPCLSPPSPSPLPFASRGSSLAPPSHSRSQGQAQARQFSENRRRLHHRHCRCLSSVNPHFRHPSAQIDPQNRFLVPPKSSKAPSPTPPATRAARIGATAAAQGQLHRPPPSRLPPASPPPPNRAGVSSWCLPTPSPSPPTRGHAGFWPGPSAPFFFLWPGAWMQAPN